MLSAGDRLGSVGMVTMSVAVMAERDGLGNGPMRQTADGHRHAALRTSGRPPRSGEVALDTVG